MHTRTASCAPRSHHRCTSTAHAPSPLSAAVPVCHRHSEAHATPVNHNLPQCCHCGWRGDHAPTCPFK
ncbi:hypothetical protein WOLCODRAFT_22572 [Wolfiporia cocos MD-104 SS10]|uniref:Uncharacterized protein n=1 Tax=Wolfiporia cocos (strain MD-104) TaxID=742152 RepID=A0A2H3J9D2_WOLCO|nr:hypothetical protein WOLCODRAFT_22572 [Wolfiporia cocos MD-104 SS10]